jgi:alpha-glucoside transport system permease protein
VSESVTTVEAPRGGPLPADVEPGFFQRYGAAIIFLAPTLVLLGVWIVYPTIRTVIRSFYGRDGSEFVGLDNYETLFTDDTLTTAIRNNFLWLLIVPAFVTAIGLVFAVLLERIRFSVAFKVVVFMPMAISLFAAGVIWRLMYEQDPSRGTINAGIAVVKDAVGCALIRAAVDGGARGAAERQSRSPEAARGR